MFVCVSVYINATAASNVDMAKKRFSKIRTQYLWYTHVNIIDIFNLDFFEVQ